MKAEAMPHDLAAERALLGAVLVDERVLALVADTVDHSDFYLPNHGALWRLFLRMSQAREPIDLVTVGSRVLTGKDRGRGEFGEPGYIAELPEHCPSTAPAATYAARVAETAAQRRLLAALHEAERQVRAGTEGGTVFETLLSATAQRKRSELVSAEDVWMAEAREADELSAGTRLTASERVLSTGYDGLDEVLDGGFKGGNLVIIGGSTSMGKSSLAMGFLAHALTLGRRALYLSCEPTATDIHRRLMSAITSVPLSLCAPSRYRDRTQQQWDLIEEYTERFHEHRRNVSYGHRTRMTAGYVTTQARREALRGQIGLIIVDHIHLMNHGKTSDERLDMAIARTSGELKALAGDLDCPVVALAQFNRTARSSDTHRSRARTSDGDWWDAVALPVKEDIREAGAIEQDADIILLPVRAGAAGPNGSPVLSGPGGDQDTAAVVKVDKHRNGRTGRVGLVWDAECSFFRSRVTSAPLFNQQEGR